MHTWALFSCSSLVTLTAYNLAQLPKDAKPGPAPDPDASDKLVEDAKFSLDTLGPLFPEFETAIAPPPLPDQPQLSKLDEPPGYNPALYDPAQYPVQEVDLVATLAKANLDFPVPDQVVTYRAETVQPLPAAIPAPPPVLLPARAPQPAAITAAPQPAAQPRPELTATQPSFAPNAAPLPTNPSNLPTGFTPVATAPVAAPSAAAPTSSRRADAAAVSPELFAALPTPNGRVSTSPEPALTTPEANTLASAPAPAAGSALADQQSMTTAITFEFSELPTATNDLAASPESAVSMKLATTRRDLINRYCDRSAVERKEPTKLAVCDDDTNELAQRIPDAATAGTPIPGSVESPTRNSPLIGVRQLGNKP